jgi:heme-degrading monooxygenase HmoA
LIHIVWEFRVRAGMEREFERRYSSTGDWARLFASSQGYEGTTLTQDVRDRRRYLVIDAWRDAGSFAAFKQAHAAAYAALDTDCERLTDAEIHVGTFETLSLA